MIKILIVFGWIFQALLWFMCLFALVGGAINLAIGLMFSLYTVAFIQEQIDMYYTEQDT